MKVVPRFFALRLVSCYFFGGNHEAISGVGKNSTIHRRVRLPTPAQLIRSDLECKTRTNLPINHCAEMLTLILRSGAGLFAQPLGGEKFDIHDSHGQLAYQVEGTFFEIPKRFTVTNARGGEVCRITKKFLTFLPQFTIDMADGHSFYLQKEYTFFKDRYSVENLGLILEGNIWDLDFQLKKPDGQLVAEISKELFHLTSRYSVTVLEDDYADLVISLVVAIDYVEMMEDASS